MAQLLAFIARPSTDLALSSGERRDGRVRKARTDSAGKHPRHMLWTFQPVKDEWGLLYDHKHYKTLLADGDKVTIDFAQPSDTRAWWKKETRAGGHVVFIPHDHPEKVLAHGAADAPVSLVAKNGASAESTEWLQQQVAGAASATIPLDDAAVDENFFNLEIVSRAGDGGKRLYLTVESELAIEVPVRIGSDPKSASAQFRLYPVGTGRVLSAGKVLATIGVHEGNERVIVSADSLYEIEMINVSGAHTFMSGDRVALRTVGRRYAGWTGGNDLPTRAWTPRGANEKFTILKVNGEGEIRPGDSFALKAGNGHYLSVHRGPEAINDVDASAPHIDAWETFTLGAPKLRAFNLRTKNIGRPVIGAHSVVGNLGPLVQRFGYVVEQFVVADRGDGMVSLVVDSDRGWTGEIAPMTDDGVAEGQQVGYRIASQAPGMLFRVVPAPASAWPETPDLTMEKYRDPAENYGRLITGGLGSIVMAATGIPGGAAAFNFAFGLLWPEPKVSMMDVLSKFREDILRDVKDLIAEHATFQAQGALRTAHEHYLITYLNLRRDGVHGGEKLTTAKQTSLTNAGNFTKALDFLSLKMQDGKVAQTEQNAAILRNGLPVYVICVAEYINALQEAAMIHAYQPKLVMPDVWLKTRDKYVTATPDGGVRYGDIAKPLTTAMRVLNRTGSKTLAHGDKVILRTPSGTNISAVGGGGGALTAKTPASQIGNDETFVIERVSNPPSATGQAISAGDQIALRTPDGKHYVSAPDGGGPLTAGAAHCAAWEMFKIEITPFEVEAPKAMLQAADPAPPYAAHVQNLRTYATLRYNDIRDMFAVLVADRIAGERIYLDKETWTKPVSTPDGGMGLEDHYTLSWRDKVRNLEFDHVHPAADVKPPGWDDPENHPPLQMAMDQYRQHVAQTYYYFKYRYFDAVRPLLRIADDTQRFCEQMWSDPLVATEYAYSARTTPVFQA